MVGSCVAAESTTQKGTPSIMMQQFMVVKPRFIAVLSHPVRSARSDTHRDHPRQRNDVQDEQKS